MGNRKNGTGKGRGKTTSVRFVGPVQYMVDGHRRKYGRGALNRLVNDAVADRLGKQNPKQLVRYKLYIEALENGHIPT